MTSGIAEGSKIGPYRIVKIFPNHRGGFAQVAMGVRDDDDGETLVAIKIARTDGGAGNDTYFRALNNEVDTLRRLKHPGIARIYPIKVNERRFSFMARAMGLPGQPWYFVMEYLSGNSVDDLIKRHGALEPVMAAEITQQLCMALDYMHAQGYSHLDVKPNNILFRRPLASGELLEAVLIDFGSAQRNERRAEVEAGALVYLPPERVQVMLGDKPPEYITDKNAVDMYAVGVVLYRMLTGQLPFSGRKNQVTTAILHDKPTRPYQYNEALRHYRELDELVMKLLDKRPERRPSAQEVATLLDQIVPPPRLKISQPIQTQPVNSTSGASSWRYAVLFLALLLTIETAILMMNMPLKWSPISRTEAASGQTIATPVPSRRVVLTSAPQTTVPTDATPVATTTTKTDIPNGIITATATPAP